MNNVELLRIAGNPNPHLAFAEMMADGVLEHVIPNLAGQVGFDQQNKHHHLPLWEHTLETVRQAYLQQAEPLTILSALLHDVAKITTTQYAYECQACGKKERMFERASDLGVAEFVDGVEYSPLPCACGGRLAYYGRQFRGHDAAGATIATRILERLCFSNAEQEVVGRMIREHINFQHGSWNPRTMRRFVHTMGADHPEMVKLLKADRLAHAPGYNDVSDLERLEDLLARNAASVADAQVAKLPVNGQDVMQVLAMKPGPRVGETLASLKEAYLDQVVTTREECLAWLEAQGKVTR